MGFTTMRTSRTIYDFTDSHPVSFRLGDACRLAGLPLSECRYPAGSAERMDFIAGYESRDKLMQRALKRRKMSESERLGRHG